MKVYDCFLYSYNPDILEIRLNVLNDVVDKFVIVESPYNWHGMFKGLEFAQFENLKRFEKFLHKIEYISVLDMPKYEKQESDMLYDRGSERAAWRLEAFNRNAIVRGISNCNDNDIIIISDFDEIPRPEIIQNIKNSGCNSIIALSLVDYFFKLNSLNINTEAYAINSIIVPGYIAKKHPIDEMRWGIKDSLMQNQQSYANTNVDLITNAGWHFSWVGDADFINTKIDGYRHDDFKSIEGRKAQIEQIKLREQVAVVENSTVNVPIDSFFPQYLVNNADKYHHLISKIVVEDGSAMFIDKLFKDLR